MSHGGASSAPARLRSAALVLPPPAMSSLGCLACSAAPCRRPRCGTGRRSRIRAATSRGEDRTTATQSPAIRCLTSDGDRTECIRDLDVDFDHGNSIASIHRDVHLVVFNIHVPGYHRQYLVAQLGEQIRLTAIGPFMREQDLKSFACDGCTATTAKEI